MDNYRLKQKFMKTLYTLIFLLLVLTLLSSKGNAQNILAYDGFECNGFDCGYGWIDNWNYTDDCFIINNNTPIGNYHLKGNGTDFTLKRVIDLSNITGIIVVNFSAKVKNLETPEVCEYNYFDGLNKRNLVKLMASANENEYVNFSFELDNYPKTENSAFTITSNLGVSGNVDDYCFIDEIYFIELPEEYIEVIPFEIDLTKQSNVIFLFILVFCYLGVMALGFTFKNGGFVSFGFFIGIVLGFMLSAFHIFLTLLFMFMNIIIFYTFVKKGR